MGVYAGIDMGTQSSKVLVYDSERKEVLSLASSPHRLTSLDDGTREQDPSWWIGAIRECFEKTPENIRKRIEGIGVSGQQHGLVALDADGKVLLPAKLWCDTSTAAECDELTEKLGGAERLILSAGNEIKPGYTAGKILHLLRHRPEIYAKAAQFLLPHDYINFYLTGTYTMEYGDASGTGFFNIKERIWNREILSAIDPSQNWDAVLPVPRSSCSIAGHLSPEAALELGLNPGIPVSSGGGDNMMAAIGTGTVRDGVLTMSLGTSGTLFGASEKPVIDPAGRLAAFCSSTDIFLPLLCTMNCTVSSELTRSLFGRDVAAFNKLAEASPVGAAGVLMLPFFNGERTPNYPNGKGSIFGLTPVNMSPENIARAAMEASIYSLRYGFDAFRELGFAPNEIRLIGGGAKSSLWRQMVSDVCSLPVLIPEITEAAAFGAALQILWVMNPSRSIGEITSEHVRINESQTCRPNPDAVPLYEEAYARWLRLLELVAPISI